MRQASQAGELQKQFLAAKKRLRMQLDQATQARPGALQSLNN